MGVSAAILGCYSLTYTPFISPSFLSLELPEAEIPGGARFCNAGSPWGTPSDGIFDPVALSPGEAVRITGDKPFPWRHFYKSRRGLLSRGTFFIEQLVSEPSRTWTHVPFLA